MKEVFVEKCENCLCQIPAEFPIIIMGGSNNFPNKIRKSDP